MNFEQFKIKIADGTEVYGGLTLEQIEDMGYENFHIYLTKYQKQNLTAKETKNKFDNYLTLRKEVFS